MTERSYAKPAMYYGDPADVIDELRHQRAIAEKKRKRNAARIRAKVRKVMRDGGGSNNGK